MNNEKAIIKSDTGEFLLTNRKVRFTVKYWGQMSVTSIMLNKISSVEFKFQSSYIFLALAVITLIIGYFSGNQDGLLYGIALGIIFAIIYFITVKKVIIISSHSSSITLSVKKIGHKHAIEFIDQLEEQIQNYKST
jgi:hypothetical protein